MCCIHLVKLWKVKCQLYLCIETTVCSLYIVFFIKQGTFKIALLFFYRWLESTWLTSVFTGTGGLTILQHLCNNQLVSVVDMCLDTIRFTMCLPLSCYIHLAVYHVTLVDVFNCAENNERHTLIVEYKDWHVGWLVNSAVLGRQSL